MRHRAPRPFVDLWHRVPRALAHRLGEAAERVPIRALSVLLVLLGLGIGGYVAISATTDGDVTRAIDPAGPATADDAERPDLNPQIPGSDDSKTDGSSPEAGTSAPGQPKTPSSPTDEPPPSSREPDLETESPSAPSDPSTPRTPNTPSTSPSTSPSQPNSSTRRPEDEKPGDEKPPNTSLSEEYPEPDAARFSFSANERASFTCSLDGAAYTSCDSPTVYTDLEPGWHTFAVRAVDSAGNVDPSPAETSWHASDGDSEDE